MELKKQARSLQPSTHMRSSRLSTRLAPLAGVLGRALLAQQPAIPVHQIGAVLERSTDSIATLTSIRPLSDGRVLINDIPRRRLLLLDPTLQQCRTVTDTTPATGRAYGTGLAGMVPFTGDSTLIEDAASSAFIVIGPAGDFARIIPAPRAVSTPPGFPVGPLFGVDLDGHLLYRSAGPFTAQPLPFSFSGDTSVLRGDTSIIRRVALATWRVDTIARLQVPAVRDFISRSANSGSNRAASTPIPAADDVTLLNDGTLAIVRVRDYHIDWVEPSGRMTSGPRIPTDWVHLTDQMKVVFMDSIRAADSVGDARATAAAVARGGVPAIPPVRVYVKPSDLPDNQPAFISGFTRADADGNLWIMVKKPALVGGATPGPIYDVINRQGERVDRVQLPAGATLVGFGPGVVFFSVAFRPAQPGKTVQLVVARIH